MQSVESLQDSSNTTVDMVRLVLLDLQVILIMTRLRQCGERVLLLQMRLNGFKIRSRRSLQRSLERLESQGLLRHDVLAKVWVVDFVACQEYLEGYLLDLKEQERLTTQAKSLVSMAQDQTIVHGSPLYSWVRVKKFKGER